MKVNIIFLMSRVFIEQGNKVILKLEALLQFNMY